MYNKHDTVQSKDLNNLEFQICDWNSYHEIDEDDEEKYVIQLFGRTIDDKDVCLKVNGYTPFFYVEIPNSWTSTQADLFITKLRNKVSWSTSSNPNYEYDLSNSLIDYKIVQKHKFYNFSNKKLHKFIMCVFKNHTSMREYANTLSRPFKVTGLNKEPVLYQRYESNIEPHIRFMHIANLSSCGWVTIDKAKLTENKKYSNCDISCEVYWKHVKPSDNDDKIAPFKIMAYDIECVSCDNNFPRADRKTDKIIQIGITMYRYGSMKCYDQHILTLNKCSKIKGANVECYKSERGLIAGFAKKIAELRPDFKAGYNNFGFDDKYIYDRAYQFDKRRAKKTGVQLINLQNKFVDEICEIMGKLSNTHLMSFEGLKKSLTHYCTKTLSSSALGDNELKFFQVPGILSIDMMKVIQRDHRLVGYKLDNVSGNFITEKTQRIVEGAETDNGKINVDIYTGSTKALDKHSFIQIMIDDGYSSSPLSEGAKYYVNDICTITETKNGDEYTYQCIKTTIDKTDVQSLREALLNPMLKVYWTFAKDDMHHTLINKYFNEANPKRIRKIAKYCLKDCKLVNLLLAKLEIIVNSIGMAKVCHVPLSYLFLRGQGVKIFSLVSKKCKQKNFLIPVLHKNKKDLDGDGDESYEGATVINPKPGVYLSPIGVLDYNSLYPNSMRERNLTPECYVNDSKYDNLPGYKYHDVYITLKDKKGKTIKNIDGTPQKVHHRFAQEIITDSEIENELGHVFKDLKNQMNENIEKLQSQTHFTDDNRSFRISDILLDFKKFVQSINDKTNINTKSKNKLIRCEIIHVRDKIKPYTKIIDKKSYVYKESIDAVKSILNCVDKNTQAKSDIYEAETITDEIDLFIEEICAINNDYNTIKKLYNDLIKKKTNENNENEINKIITDTAHKLNKIDVAHKLTPTDTKNLIKNEHTITDKKIQDEKLKRYNYQDGVYLKYGILPEILTELLNARKNTNHRMNAEKDSFVKSILNSMQLAYKVTANSLYGQTGAPTSPIFFIAIAACTTAIGRERLYFAKKIVEENFKGSEIIYGDSVLGNTPLTIKDATGRINITTIEQLGSEWIPYHGFKVGESNRREKMQSLVDAQVWTANGWSKINRVIKHKTVKNIYRIVTHTGCVDVTEDHSLLNPKREIIKPNDCVVGTELMHGFMPANNTETNNTTTQAFMWGLFMRNGSCKIYRTNNGVKYSWTLKNTDIDILKKCKQYLQQTENIHSEILHITQSNSVCKLIASGEIKPFVEKYKSIFYNRVESNCVREKYKSVPTQILNSTSEIKQSFLNGYLCTDTHNADTNECVKCDVKGKKNAQSLFYLMKSLRYNVLIDAQFGDLDIFQLTYTKANKFINAIAIQKIIPLGLLDANEFVYDLETADGTFHAGIGELIVKNTDSIFINFHIKNANGEELTNKQALQHTIRLSKKAAELINNAVSKPQAIVYEKTLHPYILIAKKKYVGLLFNDDPNKFSMKAMGIVLKRRDNAPIVKIVVGGIIDYILKNRDIDKAINYTQEVLTKLMNGEYPMDKFVISKTLKARYKKPSIIAHKVLADRMALRDPGNKPQINDRIPFVYVVKDFGKKKKKDILQGDLIEHPDFVVKHKFQIDYLHYLTNQIMKPASQILELLMPESEVQKLFNRYIIAEENKRKKRQSMEKWIGTKVTVDDIKKKSNKLVNAILPEYANKNKMENTSMDKFLSYKKNESVSLKSCRRNSTKKDPIYSGKKTVLPNTSLDKWFHSKK